MTSPWGTIRTSPVTTPPDSATTPRFVSESSRVGAIDRSAIADPTGSSRRNRRISVWRAPSPCSRRRWSGPFGGAGQDVASCTEHFLDAGHVVTGTAQQVAQLRRARESAVGGGGGWRVERSVSGTGQRHASSVSRRSRRGGRAAESEPVRRPARPGPVAGSELRHAAGLIGERPELQHRDRQRLPHKTVPRPDRTCRLRTIQLHPAVPSYVAARSWARSIYSDPVSVKGTESCILGTTGRMAATSQNVRIR